MNINLNLELAGQVLWVPMYEVKSVSIPKNYCLACKYSFANEIRPDFGWIKF
jgi:hypothetical protein